jgi:WD40 repeat protein
MSTLAPRPSLWLARLSAEEREVVHKKREPNLPAHATEFELDGGLLAAQATGDGVLHVYKLDAGGNADADSDPAFKLANYQLFVRYSLSVQAFGAPGEGEIWVGAKEVSRVFGQFCFIPGSNGELVTFQKGSKKVLSVQLPPPAAREQAQEGRCYFGANEQDENAHPQQDSRPGAGQNPPDFAGSSPVCCLGSCSHELSCLSVREDGGAVAAADRQGGIKVWSLFDGRVMLDLDGAEWAEGAASPAVSTLAFVGNDCLLAACWDGAVRIWSCQCRPELELLDSLTTLERSPLVSLAVHWPDVENRSRGQEDAVIAVGAANGMLHVWKAQPGGRWQLAFVANHAVGEGPLASLAFSSKGNLLATAAAGTMASQCGSSIDTVEEESGEDTHGFVRIYETVRWGCLAAHTVQGGGPVSVQFIDRGAAVLVEGGASRAGRSGEDTGQALLLFNAQGPPGVILSPEKASAVSNLVLKASKGSKVEEVAGRSDGPDLSRMPSKQVAFAPEAPRADQRRSEGEGVADTDQSMEVPNGAAEGEEGRGRFRDERWGSDSVAGGKSTESGTGARSEGLEPRRVAEGKRAGLLLAGADLDEEEGGAPTPLPLPARLAKTIRGPGTRLEPPQSMQPPESCPTGEAGVSSVAGQAGPSCYLKEPALHSSARLLVQLEQLQAQQFDSKAALQSVAAGSKPSSVKAELAGLTGGLSLADFARLGGRGGAGEPQYTGLTPLEDALLPEAVAR